MHNILLLAIFYIGRILVLAIAILCVLACMQNYYIQKYIQKKKKSEDYQASRKSGHVKSWPVL